MAGTVKTNIVQLGDSATATQNLTIRTNVDGTFTIARGNAGATTQDILTIDANGRIATPQTVIAFNAYQTVAQSIPGTDTILNFDAEDFDTAGYFVTGASSRFTPLVPGYYQLNGIAQINGSTGSFYTVIYKNGAARRYGSYANVSAPSHISVCTDLIYMNGSTDYVDLRAASGTTLNTSPGIQRVAFSGFLVAKA